MDIQPLCKMHYLQMLLKFKLLLQNFRFLASYQSLSLNIKVDFEIKLLKQQKSHNFARPKYLSQYLFKGQLIEFKTDVSAYPQCKSLQIHAQRSFIQLQILYFAYKLKLMGCVNEKVQKDYKPKAGGPPSTQVGYSQNGQVVGPNRKSNSMNNSNSLNVTKPEITQKQESKISEKPSNSKQKNNTLNAQQSNVYINNSSIIKEEPKRSEIKLAAQPQLSEKNIKMSQSSIRLIETSAIKSQLMISALHVQGFEGDQFHGKRVKKFTIQAQIPEKDLIKESNYFDESNGDLQMRPKVTTKYADFSVGNFQQINTFPIKTYLFDRPLNDRIVA